MTQQREPQQTIVEKRAARKLEKANKKALAGRRGSNLAKLPFMGKPPAATVTVEPIPPPATLPAAGSTATSASPASKPVVPAPEGCGIYGKKPLGPAQSEWTWMAGWWEPEGNEVFAIWHCPCWVRIDEYSKRPPGDGWTWAPGAQRGDKWVSGHYYRSYTYNSPGRVVHGAQTPAVSHARIRETVETKIKREIKGATGFPNISQEDLLKDPGVKLLGEILSFRRPDKSASEDAFIAKFISPLANCSKDKYGNRWVRVPTPDGKEADILFSVHTDTVHTKPGMQQVSMGDGRMFTETDGSNCLGADDGAGVWLALQMIEAEVPGIYVFHRNEEHGAHGSRHIAEKHAPKIKHCRAAIAFDRKDYGDVITRQSGGVCCSDAFAKSLASMLGGKFAPCSGGVFTDTANYTHIIGECTNISVGYFNAHGPTEWLDVAFLLNLRDRLITAEWDKLVIERKPAPKQVYSRPQTGVYGGAYPGAGGHFNDDDDALWDLWEAKFAAEKGVGVSKPQAPADPKKPAASKTRYSGVLATPDDAAKFLSKEQHRQLSHYAKEMRARLSMEVENLQDLMVLVHLYPETLAHFLADTGVSAADVQTWFKKTRLIGWGTWDKEEI